MARWQPDARGRLMAAALELYDERGFEQTTVADIAERAGVTERTFFRHFGDKREVLFDRDGGLQTAFVEALAAAPADADAWTALAPALDAGCDFLADRRDHARRRQRVIDATPGLQERELLKLAALTAALTAGLRGRGLSELAAGVAAEAVVGAFRVAFTRWIDPAEDRDLRTVGRAALAELRAVVS
ncbi:TetR/AcrR family transcriptional regulator [Nocardioides lianchengensis]|nr:helix-turn-helix domain-containing protein [Nocardioides lianchengensis]NYG11894.1 AcrR family transcriptional regulator [Nocardioides lianchengensis]